MHLSSFSIISVYYSICYTTVQSIALSRQLPADIILVLVNSLFHIECFLDIIIDEGAMLVRYDSVGLAVTEDICCVCPHDRRIEAILTGRIAAALHVAKYGRPCLDSRRCLNSLCHRGRMSDALGIDNDMVRLSFLSASDNIVDQLLLIR